MRKDKQSISRTKGFTLTEMAIVLLIVGLLAGAILPIAGTMRDQQNRRETANKLAALDQALLNFVMTNKRLPCPADGRIPSGTANAGVAQPNGPGDCTVQNFGVVPWASLGLGEAAATDAWGTRFTYRVPTLATGFTRNNALDASRCDPAGTGSKVSGTGANPDACETATCASTNLTACTSPLNFLANRGLIVFDETAPIPTRRIADPATGTGAAYVLISHGPQAGGGYNSAGALVASATVFGTGEGWNQNNAVIRLPPANGYFHDSRLMENPNNTHFDDLISHPTIMSLLLQAQLGPRKQP